MLNTGGTFGAGGTGGSLEGDEGVASLSRIVGVLEEAAGISGRPGGGRIFQAKVEAKTELAEAEPRTPSPAAVRDSAPSWGSQSETWWLELRQQPAPRPSLVTAGEGQGARAHLDHCSLRGPGPRGTQPIEKPEESHTFWGKPLKNK